MLAGDGDVGGLLGIHLHEEMKIANAVVSIDGLELKEFDYIDIGTMLEASGAVPVVIKSLIFPGSGPKATPLAAAFTSPFWGEVGARSAPGEGALPLSNVRAPLTPTLPQRGEGARCR